MRATVRLEIALIGLSELPHYLVTLHKFAAVRTDAGRGRFPEGSPERPAISGAFARRPLFDVFERPNLVP